MRLLGKDFTVFGSIDEQPLTKALSFLHEN